MPAATFSVLAGSTSAVVTGSFPTAYQVLITLPDGWFTSWTSSAKTQSSFTLFFSTPAPADETVDYTVVPIGTSPPGGGQQSSLGDYLDELRFLLHDPQDQYWSVPNKVASINKGMQKRDLDTGANRQLIPFALTIGVDTYNFTDIGQPNVYDVIAINLLYNNLRVVLGRYSFSELNAYIRQYSPPYQWAPMAWTRYGPNQVVFGPAPSIAYVTEWDCSVYAPPLVNLTDLDPLPYPYTKPVVYYAAYRCKINERQYDEAAGFFLAEYERQLDAAVNQRAATVPSMYGAGSAGIVRII